jgi:hypothetical protein
MEKLKKFIDEKFRKPRLRSASPGQALIIVAIGFVVLLIFVGFVVDVGMMYINMGHLRRAVDAGGLAAADQFREGRSLSQMQAAAQQVVDLNGVESGTVQVETCATFPGDPELCVSPKRKLVRVRGAMDSPTFFMGLVGMPNIHLEANSVSEAASMDVVLVIDISESMTSDASLCNGRDDDGDGVVDDGRQAGSCVPALPAIAKAGATLDNNFADPSRCNPGNNCHPFREVKDAALSFVNRVLDLPLIDETDRLAIITFSNGWETPSSSRGTRLVPPGWTSDKSQAIAAVNNLTVYNPPVCSTAAGICRFYQDDDPALDFIGMGCPAYSTGVPMNPSSCTTTNIGGGLLRAGNLLGDVTTLREDSLWVVVLLTDGSANASDADPAAGHPFGYCPSSDWGPPFCRDKSSTSRHVSGDLNYDADDYARDMADFVGCDDQHPASGCTQPGQKAIVYTIGLGDQVLAKTNPDPVPHGVRLLRDIAAIGDDGNPSSDPCVDLYHNNGEFSTWCGNYYFAATGNKLNRVFEDIYSKMFVRITK